MYFSSGQDDIVKQQINKQMQVFFQLVNLKCWTTNKENNSSDDDE